MEDDRKCKNCRFWVQQSLEDISGQCRRFPPTLAQTEEQQGAMETTGASVFVGVWPDTLGIDWCGEFEPREKTLADDPIDVLNLSRRTVNVLTKARILKVRDLLGKTVEDLRGIKNFGDACLREVQERLTANRLALRPSEPEE